ncbi:MAG: tRNA (adenosine(37)-N6)-threonylcarbamoyltransferase complex dimerization subunit type 1 TsaB, partial [Candidatus Eisenbacteria bacterium]|nr:tRNA (adenosine(37)-N6)-threonylcarbamoyltransferase complex dimerization subunit type 1 TsaB [Candidatus Eisenbacteria bacterium]
MIVLGIDTSGILGGVALARGERLIGETRCDARAAASERILSQIDRLQRDLGLPRQELARIGVAIGPGSFTGLRVGLGTAQGLAMGLDLPICPVSSLAARIHAMGIEGLGILWATAQRRGELFCGIGAWSAGRYHALWPE